MSIINAVRTFIGACPCLGDFAGLQVDFTADWPTNFGLSSSGEGAPLVTYADGGQLRQHNFVLYAREFTQTDMQRVAATEFCERLARWLQTQTRTGTLPDLGEGLHAEAMAASNGMLYAVDGDGSKGLYQIQITLIYQADGQEGGSHARH